MIKLSIYLYNAVIIFSLLLRIRTRLFDTELLKINAEISSLKNKVNLYFLFNTLNNLYAVAMKENSLGTASGIIKLSGMMRYVVTEIISFDNYFVNGNQIKGIKTRISTFSSTTDSGFSERSIKDG